MEVVKKNYHLILLAALFAGVVIFYNAYIVSLGSSYFTEEVYVKNLVLDLMCDIAESGGEREVFVDSVSEIDTFKQRGVYCAAYIYDESSPNRFKVISTRSPLFGPYDPLNNSDLNRDVRLQNRGKTVITREQSAESPAHEIHIYFRWVYRETEDPIVVVLGMSKFAVETDHEAGLAVGFWIIGGASVALSIFSIVPIIRRRKGGET